MSQSEVGGIDRMGALLADFAARPPSQNWEAVHCGNDAQHIFWVWYKPAYLPSGLVVNVPDETLHHFSAQSPLTMRTVLRWLGLEAACVWQWSQFGVNHDAQQGASPQFDQPLPAPVPGVDPGIAITLVAPVRPAFPSPAAVVMPGDGGSADSGDIFENIDAEWKAIVKTERDLALCRKKLVDTLGRLGSLNRDLNHEEQLYADTADKTAWQDARRWLRDAAARVSRYLKDCDVGDVTSAVKRDWMRQIHEQYVVPKQTFDGIFHAHREFEGYRKLVQTLFVNMNGAHASAVSDGERRAQQVLSRIQAKARKSRK